MNDQKEKEKKHQGDQQESKTAQRKTVCQPASLVSQPETDNQKDAWEMQKAPSRKQSILNVAVHAQGFAVASIPLGT